MWLSACLACSSVRNLVECGAEDSAHGKHSCRQARASSVRAGLLPFMLHGALPTFLLFPCLFGLFYFLFLKWVSLLRTRLPGTQDPPALGT